MRVGAEVDARRADLVAMLEGLTRLALVDLARHDMPLLYESRVKYRPEPSGVRENWQRPIQTLRKGYGDCEDLAAWRAAELRREGDRGAMVDVKRTGHKRWHAVVRRGDGTIEDPTAMLRKMGRHTMIPGR